MISATSELSPAAHARIRRHIALIPVYLWVVFSWTNLLTRIPADTPVRDFAHFYTQGVAAREHDAAALYDMDAMGAITSRVVPGAEMTKHLYPPVYGPQVSVFLSPLAHLPYRAAKNVWLGLSLLIYALCCYVLWRHCPELRARRAMTIGLAAAAPALHYLLGFVQLSAVGLACVTGGFLALRAGRPLLAGLAIGSLAYKPPLGLAFAFVLIASSEWRIVSGAAIGAAVQIAIGVLYWGPSILPRYVSALARLPQVADAMEPNRYHMHSWRAFFDLMPLPAPVSLAAYLMAAGATAAVALWCWRTRGPLVMRYAALLIASVLVDPHLYAYDLVLLVPALMLLWDWVLAQPQRALPFKTAFIGLLYLCYLSPIFTPAADLARVQLSVPLHTLLLVVLAGVLRTRS